MREFRRHWPNLLGACIGLALGSALNHYMMNLFGPVLIKEFGWQRSQFALVGSLSLFSLVLVPVAGHFADRFGPRISLMVGFTVVPLGFLALSFMTGNIYQLYAILLIKSVFGVLTTTLVFARVIVERFDQARGMALSLLMSGAPLIGAICVPIIGEVIETEGWRTGYRVLAAMSALGGIAAIVLAGGKLAPADPKVTRPARHIPTMTRETFLGIVRQPVFLLLIAGMLFCNFPQVIVSSQMNIVLMDSGATASLATWLVSLYAVSVVIGRFITGLALDRVPSHVVALFALGLPAVGLAVIASPLDASWLLAGSIALIGLAQGAEGDVGAFIASRHFPIEHYSFVYSFLIAAIGGAAAIGSIVLSAILHRTDSFDLFLIIGAALTIGGALCFYMIGFVSGPPHEPVHSAGADIPAGELA